MEGDARAGQYCNDGVELDGAADGNGGAMRRLVYGREHCVPVL